MTPVDGVVVAAWSLALLVGARGRSLHTWVLVRLPLHVDRLNAAAYRAGQAQAARTVARSEARTAGRDAGAGPSADEVRSDPGHLA